MRLRSSVFLALLLFLLFGCGFMFEEPEQPTFEETLNLVQQYTFEGTVEKTEMPIFDTIIISAKSGGRIYTIGVMNPNWIYYNQMDPIAQFENPFDYENVHNLKNQLTTGSRIRIAINQALPIECSVPFRLVYANNDSIPYIDYFLEGFTIPAYFSPTGITEIPIP